MDDQQQGRFTIRAHVSHALWPGDGVFCTRVSAPPFINDLFQLVDGDGRVSELRVYRLGMFKEPT